MCRLAQGVSLGSTCANKSRDLREFGGHKIGCILWGAAATLTRRASERWRVSRGGGNHESHGLHEKVIVRFPILCLSFSVHCFFRPWVGDYSWIVGRAPRGAPGVTANYPADVGQACAT